MTSRVHNEPSAWTHESRARVLSPASGALSHGYSPASFFSPAGEAGRGARSVSRPPNPCRIPEHSRRRGLPSLGASFIHLQLRVSLHAERDCQAFNVDPISHLRRRSVLAPNRQRSI